MDHAEQRKWLIRQLLDEEPQYSSYEIPAGTQEQKDMFLLLITVSSVGPKVAMSICSQIEPDRLALAVMGGDVKLLTEVKGLGKKTAERIILELRDKIKKRNKTADIKLPVAASGSSGEDSGVVNDAVDALVVLGYKDDVAREAVVTSYSDGIDIRELIKLSLKKMVK